MKRFPCFSLGVVILPADHRRQKARSTPLSGHIVNQFLLVALKNILREAAGGKERVDSLSQPVSLAHSDEGQAEQPFQICPLLKVTQDLLPLLRIICFQKLL